MPMHAFMWGGGGDLFQLVLNQDGTHILSDPSPMPSICSQWEEWSGSESDLIIGPSLLWVLTLSGMNELDLRFTPCKLQSEQQQQQKKKISS